MTLTPKELEIKERWSQMVEWGRSDKETGAPPRDIAYLLDTISTLREENRRLKVALMEIRQAYGFATSPYQSADAQSRLEDFIDKALSPGAKQL